MNCEIFKQVSPNVLTWSYSGGILGSSEGKTKPGLRHCAGTIKRTRLIWQMALKTKSTWKHSAFWSRNGGGAIKFSRSKIFEKCVNTYWLFFSFWKKKLFLKSYCVRFYINKIFLGGGLKRPLLFVDHEAEWFHLDIPFQGRVAMPHLITLLWIFTIKAANIMLVCNASMENSQAIDLLSSIFAPKKRSESKVIIHCLCRSIIMSETQSQQVNYLFFVFFLFFYAGASLYPPLLPPQLLSRCYFRSMFPCNIDLSY